MRLAEKITLRVKHPNLFKMLMLIVGVNLIISIALITFPPLTLIAFRQLPERGIIPPLWFWGIIFGVAGLTILYGVLSNKFRWTRRGLIASSAVGSFWSFGFIMQFIAGTIPGISAPLLWTFYTGICIITAGEPAVNPLSALLSKDIHDTLVTEADKQRGQGDGG